MPYYINLKSKHKFFNRKSIPFKNQKILGIISLFKYDQKKIKKSKQ